MIVSELGPSVEVIEAPMSRLEMDGEGWGKILGGAQEVVDVAREVVVGHWRLWWRRVDSGPTPYETHGSNGRTKTRSADYVSSISSPNLDIQDHPRKWNRSCQR